MRTGKALSSGQLERLARHLGAREAHRLECIQTLWSGYGELVRVGLDDGKTVIVKHVVPPDLPRPWTVSHRRKLRSYEVERTFYTDYARRTGARTAELMHSEPHLFVLEDLDAAGFRERTRHPDDRQVALTLNWLADFHRDFLHVPATDLWERGTYWTLETRPDELADMAPSRLKSAASRIDAVLRSGPQTLVHGDAKSANFCFGSEVAAVDFQYVGSGIGLQDVVYLLYGLDDARLERDHDRWIDRYFARLGHSEAEASWRPKTNLCWADFQRFLAGWAPQRLRAGDFADQRTQLALTSLETAPDSWPG